MPRLLAAGICTAGVFYLRIAWEVHALDTKKYAELSLKMDEAGRMVGGWKKGLISKTPAP
jgi:hypothetical protein